MIDIPPFIRGLIFDCDGTIADTMPLHYRSWRLALREHGYDLPEALFYEMAGIPTVQIVEILNQRHGYQVPVEETAARKERAFAELLPQAGPIVPVVELIHNYAGKLPMAVASGGTQAIVRRTLSNLHLLEYFQAIVTSDDVKHGKPAPDIFLESARRMGIPAAACCVFEDAELGLQAAHAAKMLAIDIRPLLRQGKAQPS